MTALVGASARTDRAALTAAAVRIVGGLLVDTGPVERLTRWLAVSPVVLTAVSGRTDLVLEMSYDSVEEAAAAYQVWWPVLQQQLGSQLGESLVIVSTRCAMFDPDALGNSRAHP